MDAHVLQERLSEFVELQCTSIPTRRRRKLGILDSLAWKLHGLPRMLKSPQKSKASEMQNGVVPQNLPPSTESGALSSQAQLTSQAATNSIGRIGLRSGDLYQRVHNVNDRVYAAAKTTSSVLERFNAMKVQHPENKVVSMVTSLEDIFRGQPQAQVLEGMSAEPSKSSPFAFVDVPGSNSKLKESTAYFADPNDPFAPFVAKATVKKIQPETVQLTNALVSTGFNTALNLMGAKYAERQEQRSGEPATGILTGQSVVGAQSNVNGNAGSLTSAGQHKSLVTSMKHHTGGREIVEELPEWMKTSRRRLQSTGNTGDLQRAATSALSTALSNFGGVARQKDNAAMGTFATGLVSVLNSPAVQNAISGVANGSRSPARPSPYGVLPTAAGGPTMVAHPPQVPTQPVLSAPAEFVGSASQKIVNELVNSQTYDLQLTPEQALALSNTPGATPQTGGPACFQIDRVFVGNHSLSVRSTDIFQCQRTCEQAAGCHYFTFAPQRSLCYHFDKVAGMTAFTGAVSGPKRCPPGTTTAGLESIIASASIGSKLPLQQLASGLGLSSANANGLTAVQNAVMGGAPTMNAALMPSSISSNNPVQNAGSLIASGLGQQRPVTGGVAMYPDSTGRLVSYPNPTLPVAPGVYPNWGVHQPTSAGGDTVSGQGIADPIGLAGALADATDLLTTATSVVQAGGQAFNTFPIMDVAKAGYDLYRSGFFRERGIAGGAGGGKKEERLPMPGMGEPRTQCHSEGMTCCVPRKALNKKWKKETPVLNGNSAEECESVYRSVSDELCVTAKFEGLHNCSMEKSETNELVIYRSKMIVPIATVNDAICECTLNKIKDEESGETILEMGDGFASWEFSLKAIGEAAEKKKVAEEQAQKFAKSANTALSWTKLIGDTAGKIGDVTTQIGGGAVTPGGGTIGQPQYFGAVAAGNYPLANSAGVALPLATGGINSGYSPTMYSGMQTGVNSVQDTTAKATPKTNDVPPLQSNVGLATSKTGENYFAQALKAFEDARLAMKTPYEVET